VLAVNASIAKAAVNGTLNRIGYHLIATRRLDALKAEIAANAIATNDSIDLLKLVIHDYLQSNPRPFFIQIGANDGMRDDDFRTYILDYSWEGILVEPQSAPFTRLVQNYQGRTGLRFENVAIGNSSDVMTLYGFSGTLGDMQLDVFTSSDYNRVLRVKEYNKIPSEIERFDVPTMTFQELLSKYSVNKLDILIIDAEGYDFQILKMIDFAAVCPAIIQFEQTNLSPADKVACYRMLVEKGYRLAQHHRDIIAYRNER
jgi:FkbM family methyltransferase